MNSANNNKNASLAQSNYMPKISQLLINFTYKETINSFINENGQFKKSFFYLLKSVCETVNGENIFKKFNIKTRYFFK